MATTTKRWQGLGDLAGGTLLLAAWLALWAMTWAAVAGPLAPVAARAAATGVLSIP
jgi:hypothetical protein